MPRPFYLLKNIEHGIVQYPNNFAIYYNTEDMMFHSYIFNIMNWESCYLTETEALQAIDKCGMVGKISPVAVTIHEF